MPFGKCTFQKKNSSALNDQNDLDMFKFKHVLYMLHIYLRGSTLCLLRSTIVPFSRLLVIVISSSYLTEISLKFSRQSPRRIRWGQQEF